MDALVNDLEKLVVRKACNRPFKQSFLDMGNGMFFVRECYDICTVSFVWNPIRHTRHMVSTDIEEAFMIDGELVTVKRSMESKVLSRYNKCVKLIHQRSFSCLTSMYEHDGKLFIHDKKLLDGDRNEIGILQDDFIVAIGDSHLAACYNENAVYLKDYTTGKLVSTISCHEMLKCGNYFALFIEHDIVIYDTSTRTLYEPQVDMRFVCAFQDGLLMGNENELRFWAPTGVMRQNVTNIVAIHSMVDPGLFSCLFQDDSFCIGQMTNGKFEFARLA